MTRRIVTLLVSMLIALGATAGPAAAENIFDCEGNIRLFCPGPVP